MTATLLEKDNPAATLFEQLAGRIEEMIDKGTLRPGDRIPSVRRVKAQFKVSTATVLEAFRLLEDRGRIYARPQSGHFVRLRQRDALPVPGQTRPVSKAYKVDVPLSLSVCGSVNNPELIPLGAAIPAPELLPLAALGRIAARVQRLHPARAHAYCPPPGCPELRHEIARRMLDTGCTVSADEVLITAGGQEAFYLALQAVTQPGDTVAIESPTYYGLLEALHALHLQALPIATCPREGLDPDSLAAAVQKRKIAACVVNPNFSNPLGALMSDDNKRALVELSRRHGFTLIEDDVYGDIHHEGTRPSAMKSYDPDDAVIYLSSFSKTLSPGSRIGWCIGGRHQPRLEQLKLTLNLAAATTPQLTIAEFLATGGYDRHMRRLRRGYRDGCARIRDAVGRHFPQESKITRPLGGHVLWIELPEAVDAIRLFEQATERKIGIAPGPMFSVSGNEYRNCIRLNCGLPWSDTVDGALRALGTLIERQL